MNNIEVHKFLQDHNFTKSCVRPPAIGEENEVTSVDGRMSTHSSVSGKSEVSTATPRRTDIDLGFEPEGSASPLPMCDGWWSSLPCVLEDSEGLRLFRTFLADSEQAQLLNGWLACKGFRESGNKNSNSNNSSAASSTTGPLTAQRTQMDIAMLQTRGKLARKIFNTYLRKDKSKACTLVSSAIEDSTRQHICKQIKNAFQSQKSTSSFFELDVNLFDQAQKEIEHYIEENCYHSFLNSDILQKYAAKCESNKKQPSQVLAAQTQNENKNGPSNVLQVPPPAEAAVTSHYLYLPRLVEDQIWHPPLRPKSETISTDKDQSLNSTMSSGVSQSSLAKQAMKRNMAASHAQYSNLTDGPDQNHPAYAYLVAPSANKYYVPPASANASDNASSDATSDTLSITDGSLDLEPFNSKKNQKRLIRHHTKRNPNMYCPAEDHFISLTRRCNYKQNLATLATDNPKEFFAQLKEKLDRVLEERKRKEIMEAAAMDNTEDILDSHIERVGHMKTPNPIESPNRNQSPPPVVPISRNSALVKSQSIPANISTSRSMIDERILRQQQKDPTNHSAITQHRPENFDHTAMMRNSLRRRKEVAVGMAPNEVPDVTEVPAPPVDKNSFIKEWIKQQDKPAAPRNAGPQPRRGSMSKSGRPSKYINPSDSFPTQAQVTSKASPYRSQPLQPISQDTSMPLLSNPDPNTMLEEVKRRLIEETEEKCHITDSMRAVAQQNAFVNPAQLTGLPFTPATSSSSHRMDLRHAPLPYNQIPGSAISSGIGPSDSSHFGAKTGKTTCIYFMQNEEFPYKIQIPHSSVTLGQFKQYIRRKGNYAYFFKQYCTDIGEPVYFQIVKDNEILPLWENAVVAKVKIASS